MRGQCLLRQSVSLASAVAIATAPKIVTSHSDYQALSLIAHPPSGKHGKGGPTLSCSQSVVLLGLPSAITRTTVGNLGVRVGEAKNPGPSEVVAVSCNVTSLFRTADIVKAWGAQVIAIQEHGVATHCMDSTRARMGALGYDLFLTGPDPESERPCGGVAIAVQRPLGARLAEHRSSAFADAVHMGRAIMAIVAIGSRTPTMFIPFLRLGFQQR